MASLRTIITKRKNNQTDYLLTFRRNNAGNK